MLQDILESALSKEQLEAGFYLRESATITLMYKDESIISWPSTTVTYSHVQEAVSQVRTCRKCTHTGLDVTEQPTFSPVLGRDTTEYLCNDIEACLDRSLPSYYQRRLAG